MGIIEIDKTLVPYQFDITLSNKNYTINVNYNYTFDFFTIDLILGTKVLVKAEKVVLDQFLFKEIYKDANGNLNEDFPEEVLFVSSGDNIVKRVSFDNLGDTVFLYYAEKEELA